MQVITGKGGMINNLQWMKMIWKMWWKMWSKMTINHYFFEERVLLLVTSTHAFPQGIAKRFRPNSRETRRE
jgi:hypothetical protein